MKTVAITVNSSLFTLFTLFSRFLEESCHVVLLKDDADVVALPEGCSVLDSDSAIVLDESSSLKLLGRLIAVNDPATKTLQNIVAGLWMRCRDNPDEVWQIMLQLFRGLELRLDQLDNKGQLTAEAVKKCLTFDGLVTCQILVFQDTYEAVFGRLKEASPEQKKAAVRFIAERYVEPTIGYPVRRGLELADPAFAAAARKRAEERRHGRRRGRHHGRADQTAGAAQSQPQPAATTPAAPEQAAEA